MRVFPLGLPLRGPLLAFPFELWSFHAYRSMKGTAALLRVD